MNIWKEIRPRLKSVAVPVVTATVLSYFAYHALEGAHGFKSWLELSAEKDALVIKAAEIRDQREALQNKVALLKPDNLDPDLLSERVREQLGLNHPEEVILYDAP